MLSNHISTMLQNTLPEERYDLGGKLLSCAETLREQHDLGNELAIRLCHGQATEQLLEIVRQIATSSVTRIHGDEDGHVRADLDLLTDQLNGNG